MNQIEKAHNNIRIYSGFSSYRTSFTIEEKLLPFLLLGFILLSFLIR